MAEPARKKMTVAEFLRWDDGTGRRYELVDGEIVAMAPPIKRHGGRSVKIAGALDRRVRPPCWVGSQLGILLPHRNDAFYEADVAVTCEPEDRERFLSEPRIIVEILSPSTQDHDLFQKLPDYRQIESLEDVLYVSTDERLVRHWVRGQESRLPRAVREGAVQLLAFGLELPIDEVYEGSDL